MILFFYGGTIIGTQNGSGQDHEHDHDTHYHGEPSRVLDNRPLPEAVVLYGSGQQTGSGEDSWLEALNGVEEVHRVYAGERGDHSGFDLDVRSTPIRNRNPFDNEFEGFNSSIKKESSLLFVPVGHPRTSAIWKDLRSNDVTVNWLTVDTDPDGEENRPRLVVLSDWIAKMGDDVPAARSTGVATGIFHLTSEALESFDEIGRADVNFPEAFSSFLDDPTNKLRPCFLRERNRS